MNGVFRAFLLTGAVLSACSNPINYPTRTLRRPIALAVTCKDASGKPVTGECTGTGRYPTLWAVDADLGSVGIVDAVSGSRKDTDKFIPGYTSLTIGEDPVAIRSSPASDAVYVLLRRGREMVRVGVDDLALTRQALPCAGDDIELAALGPAANHLLVPCPDEDRIVLVPLADFGKHDPAKLDAIPAPARPRFATLSPDGNVLYVTREHAGFLGKIDLATRAEKTVPLFPACADGLDDDGDGLVDAADPGCRGPTDDDESGEETRTCTNGIDDDKDGTTDANDPDCPASEFPAKPACANDEDDDGDGLTDTADPDCYGPMDPDEAAPAPRGIGQPAVTPDGKFVYVPLSGPGGVAVFTTNPLARVDVNAADGPTPNALLSFLGVRDLLFYSPAREVGFIKTSETTRAFVALDSGQIARVTVMSGDKAVHAIDPYSETATMRSSATAFGLKVAGTTIDRSSKSYPEYPSFGPRAVTLVPGTDNLYNYYGVTFHGDPSLELNETWRVTFEGVIPGASGTTGFLADDTGGFTDPTADLCAAGVEAGDLLVLKSAAELDCDGLKGTRFEYVIDAVGPVSLQVSATASGPALPTMACMPGPLDWEVRARGAWTVVGTRSGFMHPWTTEGDACVKREDLDARFTGRAVTSMPGPGKSLASCPPLDGAPEIAWQTFSNVAFSFRIFPACQVDATYKISIVPEIRDTELSFMAVSGFLPKVASVGGIPAGLTPAGTGFYVAESAFGTLYFVSGETMTVQRTYY